MVRLRGAVAAAALVLVAVSGCAEETTGTGGSQETEGAATPHETASGGAVLAAIDSLTVKSWAPKDGYGRDRFGSPWADTDSNGCDTRDDILRRDLKNVKFTDGDCKVASGLLAPDPYGGENVTFARGRSQVDIDHIVALSNAWQTGAKGWAPSKRIALANDPLNLLAVGATPNRSKGDGDASNWLPPNKAYRCSYVAAQVAVKKKYELWVTAAEKTAMKNVIAACPSQRLPSGGNPTNAPDRFHAN
ncbi:HNH endonuclease family protein [Streptomyces sp. RY43-2]|uniref:HNH endonuclease family protein n=1 Tax=Streptomyces macrolidinus TaxID=2952607 RepID=A0ABT0ZEC0_9ACTN|nr:HNH endonuclease family protein [Streptomyces macrolidinus]MCN9241908.1 HNH endonuclease family protein [Streptomyces macrolidinus]